MYTEAQVYRDICAKHEAKTSLRDIAAEYENITHGDISRILKGQFPTSDCKRKALHLIPLVPTAICPIHGIVHVRATCPGKSPRRVRWVREAGHAGGRWM
jgi:hypothetical protein